MATVRRILPKVLSLPLVITDNLFAGRKSQVLKVVRNDRNFDLGKPTVVYATYAENGMIRDDEHKTLKGLRDSDSNVIVTINVDEIHFVSRSHLDLITKDANIVLIRRNLGFDLAAYKDAYYYLKDHKLISKQIVFLNSSIIWFPAKVSSISKQFHSKVADIASATVSRQYIDHIQTFCFSTLTKEGNLHLENWFLKIKNWKRKQTAVSFGELATNEFFQTSCRLEVLYSESQLFETAVLTAPDSQKASQRINELSTATPINPSHIYWLELVKNGFPGIKRDLVISNPTRIESLGNAISILKDEGMSTQILFDYWVNNRKPNLINKLRKRIRI